MTLTKNGEVINLDNPEHINAYKCAGWEEKKEQIKAPKPKKK